MRMVPEPVRILLVSWHQLLTVAVGTSEDNVRSTHNYQNGKSLRTTATTPVSI